ncbi:MarR family winged helix-turn-helix transcriptional regulator [Micromonosporaceae bacterium Da 78-11]
MDDPAELDFWSFIELASRRLSTEFGSTHQRATELLLTLNRAANVVTYDLESAVHRPHGLSWSGFRLMFVTWLAGPVEMKTAARLSGMSRAGVSNLTRGLEAAGLIARAPDERDGRSVRLSLTAAGVEKITAIYRDHNEREHAWASGLTEIEQQVLMMLLDKLVANRGEFRAHGRN